ncbi:hypothetical protein B0H19DRAFT_1060662 [Mycena capillaripes]|nr:hypothetical protein B0H19DRAFT_1060662 [Mycena capillaripes]
MRGFTFVFIYAFFWRIVNAVLSNTTIDDIDPSVIYQSPFSGTFCSVAVDDTYGCEGVDYSQFKHGTLTRGVKGKIAIPFTVYVFVGSLTLQPRTALFLDQTLVGTLSVTEPTLDPHSLLVYQNTSLANRVRIFEIVPGDEAGADFDALIYSYAFTLWGTLIFILRRSDELTSTDSSVSIPASNSEQTPTSPMQSNSRTSTTSTTSVEPAIVRTQSSSSQSTSSPPVSLRKKPAAATIAGGVIGAILSLAVSLLAFYVLRRRARRTSAPDEEMSPGPRSEEKGTQIVSVSDRPATRTGSAATGSAGIVQAERNPSVLEEQIRVLKGQLQAALQAHDDATHAVTETESSISDASPLTRSFSTMKREQTFAVQDNQAAARDLLVHTDSGLRLESARSLEELPPVYVARNSFVDRGLA